MLRIAFVLFSGPESPCKLQHAFLFARDIVRSGGQALIIFEGLAPKWLLELRDPAHKLAKLFAQMIEEDLVAGVCRGCAAQHGALEAAEERGLALLADAFGHVSLVPLLRESYEIVIL